MGVASLAVVVLTVDYGRLPYIALVLAFTFGTYGLAEEDRQRRRAREPGRRDHRGRAARRGLPRLAGRHRGVDVRRPRAPAHALLLASTGIVTAVPLICFGAAATRVPMTTLGLLQYLAPVLQFALGVFVLDEDMPASRWIGFVLVWIALVIFTVEATNHHRRQLRLTALASAA